jgi:hypothetical protein
MSVAIDEHWRRTAQSTLTASTTRHSTRMNSTAEPLLRQDEKSEPKSRSEDTPQCDLHKETSNGTANRHNLAPIGATQTRISRCTYLAVAEHNIARRRTQHAASQATRTAKTATHAMATASAASSATAPAPVTQTEHAAVIGDDLGRRANLCEHTPHTRGVCGVCFTP